MLKQLGVFLVLLMVSASAYAGTVKVEWDRVGADTDGVAVTVSHYEVLVDGAVVVTNIAQTGNSKQSVQVNDATSGDYQVRAVSAGGIPGLLSQAVSHIISTGVPDAPGGVTVTDVQ